MPIFPTDQTPPLGEGPEAERIVAAALFLCLIGFVVLLGIALWKSGFHLQGTVWG
jgi:hypothetical protein